MDVVDLLAVKISVFAVKPPILVAAGLEVNLA